MANAARCTDGGASGPFAGSTPYLIGCFQIDFYQKEGLVMRAFIRCCSLLASLVAALGVSSIDGSAAVTCASVHCVGGTHCVDLAIGPTCVPNLTCANVHCISGLHCVNTLAGPKCVPNQTCATVHCAGGSHCVNTETGPKCVPNLTCATVDCKAGFHCVDTATGPKCVGGPVQPPAQRKY